MKVLLKVNKWLINVLGYIGMIFIGLLMLIIAAGVIFRLLGNPIMGSVELAEIFHLVLIMFSFAYTQYAKEHITISLVVDRFSEKIQKLFDGIALLLTTTVCLFFSFTFLVISTHTTETTLLLDFPYSILKIIISIGFFAWGFTSFIQLLVEWKSKRTEVNKDV